MGRWLVAAERHELVWDLPRPEVESESPSALVFYRAGFVPRLVAFVADWMVILFLVNLVVMPWRESLQELLKQVQVQAVRVVLLQEVQVVKRLLQQE